MISRDDLICSHPWSNRTWAWWSSSRAISIIEGDEGSRDWENETGIAEPVQNEVKGDRPENNLQNLNINRKRPAVTSGPDRSFL